MQHSALENASGIHHVTERHCLGAQTNNSAMFAEVLLSLCCSCIRACIDDALTEAMLPAASVILQ